MPISQDLENLLKTGHHRIGEIEIQTNVPGHPYAMCHHKDTCLLHDPHFGSLSVSEGPESARDLSMYAADGSYRFGKAQQNLKQGWVLVLKTTEQLRQALDLFYPAAVGLFFAQKTGTLKVEYLRDKLNRQTGMYRFARTISDTGAQQLVREVCGPAHQCAKRILWKIDSATPLDDSEASRFSGIPDDIPENEAIPLLCREACNHFVAECRRVAKAEFAQKENQ